jgi:hypothetical protein
VASTELEEALGLKVRIRGQKGIEECILRPFSEDPNLEIKGDRREI